MANRKIIVHASAAETATGNSGRLGNPDGARGLYLALKISAAGGTSPTLDIKAQRLDHVTGDYIDLPGGAFAQKTGTGSDDLVIYPGIAETANRSVSDVIGEDFRIVWTITGTGPTFTFTLAAELIP